MPNVALGLKELTIGRQYDRPHLARVWGYDSWRGFGKGVFTPAGERVVILFVTRIKQASLTQYVDYISGSQLHWEGEKEHGSDQRLASATKSGDQIHLFYRERHHTDFEYKGPVVLTEFEPRSPAPSRFVFELVHRMDVLDDLVVRDSDLERLKPTEREAVTTARMGQGPFRKDLLSLWGGRDSITDTPFPEILRASHIKPWRDATNDERLNPFNGLLLLPHHDALFDRGYITFARSGDLMLSPIVKTYSLPKLGITADTRLRHIDPRHREFLDYHRSEIFKHSSKSE